MWLFQRQRAAERARAKAKADKRRPKRKRSPKPYDPSQVKHIPVTPEQIDQLVALAQGQVPVSEGEWFYQQFIRFSRGLAKTPEHVRQYLADAHWLEEEDLRQQIEILRWILKQKSTVIRDEYWRLTTAFRIYLLRDAKVFRKDTSHLQAMYQYDIDMAKTDEPPEPVRNLDLVFETNKMYSTFDRYVIYLYHCLGQTEKEMADTLLLGIESAVKIKQNMDTKIKDTQEKANGNRNSTGPRHPTLAVFTSR